MTQGLSRCTMLCCGAGGILPVVIVGCCGSSTTSSVHPFGLARSPILATILDSGVWADSQDGVPSLNRVVENSPLLPSTAKQTRGHNLQKVVLMFSRPWCEAGIAPSRSPRLPGCWHVQLPQLLSSACWPHTVPCWWLSTSAHRSHPLS
jgi:hypothetical protein